MTREPGAKDASPASTDEDLAPWMHDPNVLAWAGEHLPDLRCLCTLLRRPQVFVDSGICMVTSFRAVTHYTICIAPMAGDQEPDEPATERASDANKSIGSEA